MKNRIAAMLVALAIALSALYVCGVTSDETLFERFIPINQAYSANVNPYTVKTGTPYNFNIGTQFSDENKNLAFASPLKRSELQGCFLKLTLLGRFASLDKAAMMKAFGLKENDYLLIIGDPSAEPYDNYKEWITKDALIISVDLYDASKSLMQNISPACAIMAVGSEGEFLTLSRPQGVICSMYFSTQDNIFKGTDDKKTQGQAIRFTPTYAWLEDEYVAEGLIGSSGKTVTEVTYEFKQYPEISGKAQYMTNNILSVNEFIAPDNTYYQVGRIGDAIDPVVVNKIENVIDYSEYGLVLSPGYTRRSILTSDGTLYGVTTKYEKSVLATGVKQAGKAHYLTQSGEVKETVSGKTVAADCKEFAEHRYATVIGILKDDGSCYLGYTYLGDEKAYKKGLTKVLDNAKTVVAGGVCGEDNRFYRWREDVIGLGYDEEAFLRGEFIQYNDFKLSLEFLTDNAVRVFPKEYFTAEQSTSEDAMTGFVVNGEGHMWAFGLQTYFDMGELGLIKHIFPIYQHRGNGLFDNGNFVGLLPEENGMPYGMVANHCSLNRPTVGKLSVDYLSDVPGGYKALDGYTYAFDNDADDGTSSKGFRMKPTAFHYLNDGGEMFKAINTSTNPVGILNLLPNVARSSYQTDNSSGNTVLLERTDGSMWMTQIYPRVSAANIVAKLGGWECSNAIQITAPTTMRTAAVDYEDLVSGGTLSTLFNLGETKYPEDTAAEPYTVSDYYTEITPAKADGLYREDRKFLLLICKPGCAHCKQIKPYIKTAIERDKVPIYGCNDTYSSIQFYWDFVKGGTVGTPVLVLVNGKGEVEVKSSAYKESDVDMMLAKAKAIGVETDKSTSDTSTSQSIQRKRPSDKLSLSNFEWEVLRLVNRERFKEGLCMLAMPSALQAACNTRENELVTLYDHTRPNGERPYTAISSSFKYNYAAENIACGQRNAAQVVKEWMESPGHRANIMQPKFGYMGVGAINSNPPYWVQLFADSAEFTDVTSSTGSLSFASEEEMQTEYLVCTDKNGVASYLPIDTEYMTKNGNSYTLKLSGRQVTLTVGEMTSGRFSDVKSSDWYNEAVTWAVDNAITSGTSATTFSPKDTCTRAQILTFLWRAVGSPKAKGANTFTDVKATDYYYDAALWAKEKGMVSGSLFEGSTPCTRSSTVVYLWKNAGSPSISPSGAFTDVDKSSDYAVAVAWALENGVTSGTSATTFSPNDTCTRAQIVTFLMRAMKR